MGIIQKRVFVAEKQAQASPNGGQTAIEYMLLLGVVVAAVLIGLRVSLPRTRVSAERYFNRTVIGILGAPNPCGDGYCCNPFEDNEKCPPDCDGVGGDIFSCPPCGDGYCCGPSEDTTTCALDCDSGVCPTCIVGCP